MDLNPTATHLIKLAVLNTLDLLKKGTSPIAIHARAASRFLESQVGANPRIRVQRDEEFIPWDFLYDTASTAAAQKAAAAGPGPGSDSGASLDTGTAILAPPSPTSSPSLASASAAPLASVAQQRQLPPEDRAPEWVRQVICCTAWEVTNPAPDAVDSTSGVGGAKSRIGGKPAGGVALAVVRPLSDELLALVPTATTTVTSKTAAPNAPTADQPNAAFVRNVQRATGDLMRVWASMLGFKILGIDATSTAHGHGGHGHSGEHRSSPNRVRESDKEGGGKRGGSGPSGHRNNRSIDGSGQEGTSPEYSWGGWTRPWWRRRQARKGEGAPSRREGEEWFYLSRIGPRKEWWIQYFEPVLACEWTGR